MNTTRSNIAANLTSDLHALADLVRAHDTLHPDRDLCGGVGRCLMMRTEVDAETSLLPRLVDAVIRYGLILAAPDGEPADERPRLVKEAEQ